jgi:uncharacterized protein YbaR (Trm112 family)
MTTLDPLLAEVLACPCDAHAALTYDADASELTCVVCGRVFAVIDGIPQMLLDEARLPGASGPS